MTERETIVRVWHGWTRPEDATAYERLLTDELVPEFAEEVGNGFKGFELLRRVDGDEVEFVTLIRFDSWDAVERFAGEDYEIAHVPPEAEKHLSRYEDRAAHYVTRA